MALVKCRECKKDVSDMAPRCPHCGVECPDREAYYGKIADEEEIEDQKRRIFGGAYWLIRAVAGLALGIFIAHAFTTGRAQELISSLFRSPSGCQVVDVTAAHDVFIINGEADAGVRVTALIKKLKSDGKVVVTAELSSSEGTWTRSTSGELRRDEQRSADVLFPEPTIAATNLRYNVKCVG